MKIKFLLKPGETGDYFQLLIFTNPQILYLFKNDL
jgi:hypothetical protein